jgi:hypothetical protein
MSTHFASPVPSGLPEGLADHRLLTSDESALMLGLILIVEASSAAWS